MALSAPTPYALWTDLEDNVLTVDVINQTLGALHDDLWVVSACVDRVINDSAAQHALLTLGLARTDHVVDRCTDIISLSSPPSQGSSNNFSTLRTHFQSTPTDGLLCYLRSVLLRRLDRLNAYVEMEKEFPKGMDMELDDVIEEWEDDPWAEANATPSSKTPQSKSTEPAPISLADFLQNDLLWSACELAASQAINSLHILLKSYSTELWPRRFKIHDCIPEYTHPSQCLDILPALDTSTNREIIHASCKRRQDLDFSELESTQDAMTISTQGLTLIPDSDKLIDCTPIMNPLTADELSTWYKSRVHLVINTTGMVDVALALVQHGASQGIALLDELGEELSLLSRLVYDAPQGKGLEDDWTLDRWYSMTPIAVVRAYLAHSSPESLPNYISHLVMPYLYVLEAKAERTGTPDSALPTRTLYEYILTTSLDNSAAIFEASKPTLPTGQRTIKNDEDMVRLALACLYGSNSLDEWTTMSRIFECLPVWDIPKDDEETLGEAADTTVASLGFFVTASTNQPQCTAKDLLVFFEPLPSASLSRALDILDVHLESGEILSRWSVAAPLRWFLQSSGNIKEQRAWATRMARRAGGKTDKLDGLDDWEWLLTDMWKLTGNGNPSARGAFCLLSKQEITSIFLAGLLSTGNFNIAKTMLHGPRHKIKLSHEIVEAVCLASSREFYDNASSGNYNFGDMKLAYECLEVPQLTETIAKEKDFIEATSRLCSFNVSSAPGVTITPIEIRLTKDKLSLISRVLSSNSDGYKHTQVILELGYKLGYGHDPVAEVKILAMLADTALQLEDFTRAYENNERMVQVVTELRRKSSLGLDGIRAKEASEVCWIACFQLGRQPEFPDLAKKMILLGYALELCPPEKIHDVLTAWRKYESEDIQLRKENLDQKRVGGSIISSAPKMEPINVASSLRARLHDFHMPSPPLLSTPDAAALASRTFKSVAANFPFAVGSRGRSHASDIDEKSSARSESSRRTDGEDVSTQASRVISKGIGWLIGADEEL